MRETPVSAEAKNLNIPVIEAEKIDSSVEEQVLSLQPELLAVVAYGTIFKKQFIDVFPRGGINLHPSLLPKYRGPSPIPAAILAGESVTGVTIQELALEMDSGAVLAQEKIEIKENETAGELTLRAADIGADCMVDVIERIESGARKAVPQNDAEATYCRLLTKKDGKIDWNNPAEYISNKIRAFNPWPKAYTYFNGQQLNLLRGLPYPGPEHVIPATNDIVPGRVLGIDKKTGILIQTGDAIVAVTELQLQAKKVLDWKSFLNGTRDFIGSVLGDET